MLECDDCMEVIDMLSDGVAKVDPEGKFVFVNTAYCHLLRRSPREIIGHSYLNFTHNGDREADKEQAEKVKSGEIIEYAFTKSYEQKGSTELHPLYVTGFLSVRGIFERTEPDGPIEFQYYLVVFRPYDENTRPLKLLSTEQLKWLLSWITSNYKTLTAILLIVGSLVLGNISPLLDLLEKAKKVQQEVESTDGLPSLELLPQSESPSLPESTSTSPTEPNNS